MTGSEGSERARWTRVRIAHVQRLWHMWHLWRACDQSSGRRASGAGSNRSLAQLWPSRIGWGCIAQPYLLGFVIVVLPCGRCRHIRWPIRRHMMELVQWPHPRAAACECRGRMNPSEASSPIPSTAYPSTDGAIVRAGVRSGGGGAMEDRTQPWPNSLDA